MTTNVTEYYIEIEAYNIRTVTSRITYTCNCGEKIIKPGVLTESMFGKQKFCGKCNNLIYTISKKITWREYVSGKPSIHTEDD